MKEALIVVIGIPIVVSVTLIGGILWFTNTHTPLRWRACNADNGGWGSVPACITVDSRDQIQQLPNGCITDGTNRICGSYWLKQDRW